ncbi:hypothetical protein E2C01_080918 [Portunus trituberculatus]|uniref:Uncharacterized protein n=1 Tax=Portunus trituberculatus TaxID=210409 RepID=A0A5B7IQL6_PORTR|nr:hypothetical protein [Portunus trituberculatus]
MWCCSAGMQVSRSGDVAPREGNRRGMPSGRRERQIGKAMARKGQDKSKSDARNTQCRGRRNSGKSASRVKGKKGNESRGSGRMGGHSAVEDPGGRHGPWRQDSGRHGSFSSCCQAPKHEGFRQEQTCPDTPVHSSSPPPRPRPRPLPAHRATLRPPTTTGPRAQTQNTKPQEATKRKAPATTACTTSETRRSRGKGKRKRTKDSSMWDVKLESEERRGGGRAESCRRKADRGHPRREKIRRGETEGNGIRPRIAQCPHGGAGGGEGGGGIRGGGGVKVEWPRQVEEVGVSKEKDGGSGSSPPQLQGTRAAQSGKPLKGIRKQPGASSPAGEGLKKRVRL